MKIWKQKTQEVLKRDYCSIFPFIYDFICDVEATAYDLTKSLLIDAESHEFNNSISVISIISVSIDIFLMMEFTKSKLLHSPLLPDTLNALKISVIAWN